MQKVAFGNTGLRVSRLGVGCSGIGYKLTKADVAQAGKVLNSALDAGVNFLDTAACYGISEELIGMTVSNRREDYVLATKCGDAVDDESGESWTYDHVQYSIERSLTRLRTDHLDLVQLHSCEVDVLERGDVIEALLKAKRDGKTRFVGYSGDEEAAAWAVESGVFDALQTSFNLVDQRARHRLLGPAKARGMGIIVKRPIANGAWGVKESPSEYANEYHRRAQIMAWEGTVKGAPDDRILLAMGFVFAHPEVDTAIVGTQNPSHMQKNIDMVENQLPIQIEPVEELHRRFDKLEEDWVQQI